MLRTCNVAPRRAPLAKLTSSCGCLPAAQAGVPRHEELLLKFRFTEALDAALATTRQEVRVTCGAFAAAAVAAPAGLVGGPQGMVGTRGADAARPLSAPTMCIPSQVVESVVQALSLHGALEATLSAAPVDLVASLLLHVRRQLSSPQHARGAIGLAHCLLSRCPAALAVDGPARERLQQLRAAVGEELRTQEQLLALQGVVGAIRTFAPRQ